MNPPGCSSRPAGGSSEEGSGWQARWRARGLSKKGCAQLGSSEQEKDAEESRCLARDASGSAAHHPPRYLPDSRTTPTHPPTPHGPPARRGGKARQGRPHGKAGAEGKWGGPGSAARPRFPGPICIGVAEVSSGPPFSCPCPPFAGGLGGGVGGREGTERDLKAFFGSVFWLGLGCLGYFFLHPPRNKLPLGDFGGHLEG